MDYLRIDLTQLHCTAMITDSGGLKEAYITWGTDAHTNGQLLCKRTCPMACLTTFCRELCKNGRIHRLAVRVDDFGEPNEAQVQSYSPGGAKVPSWDGTLAAGATWQTRLNRPSVAAMRPYVKVL